MLELSRSSVLIWLKMLQLPPSHKKNTPRSSNRNAPLKISHSCEQGLQRNLAMQSCWERWTFFLLLLSNIHTAFLTLINNEKKTQHWNLFLFFFFFFPILNQLQCYVKTSWINTLINALRTPIIRHHVVWNECSKTGIVLPWHICHSTPMKEAGFKRI